MRNWQASRLTGLLLALSLALAARVVAAAQTSTPNPRSQSAPASQASSPEGTQPDQARAQETSTEQLKLTLDQKEKIAAVMDDQDQQLSALRDDASLTPDQKQQKAAHIRDAATSKIRAILTSEQLQKLATMQQRVREQPQQEDQNAPPEEPQH
jgi:protein CpxP